ncbi:MAG: hypothetical protein DWQ07_12260 [Chloroflexi bacterium]|nr:MAG: hypothetical protein DWQ07_12260 [Chloroflexota bacterium]
MTLTTYANAIAFIELIVAILKDIQLVPGLSLWLIIRVGIFVPIFWGLFLFVRSIWFRSAG